MKKLVLISSLLLLAGCGAPSASNLYWGSYSHTLYAVKKDADAAAHRSHEEELLSLVEKAKEKNLRVPPGVYAELGIYAMERGDKAAGEQYFNLEKEVYPEGAVLMERVQTLY